MALPERCVAEASSFEGLDQRIELRLKRLVMGFDGWDLAVDPEQLIDSHLGRAYGILHREDDILWNFHKLTDER